MNIEISKVEFDALPREQQVIWLAADGKTDKNISQILGISTDTVSTYWKRIMVKFNSSSRTEVVATFLRQRFEATMEKSDSERRMLRSELRNRGNNEQQQAIAAIHLNALMGLLDMGVLFTGPGLKITYVNDQLCKLAGSMLLPKEVIGTDLEYFLALSQSKPTGGQESTFSKTKALMAGDQEYITDEVLMSDGRTIQRSFLKVILQGQVAGMMLVFKEVLPKGRAASTLELQIKDMLVERAMAHLESPIADQRKQALVTMERIAGLIGADRSMIGEINLTDGTFNICCSWQRSSKETFTENHQPVPASFFPWLKSQIKENNCWSFGTTDEIPKAASMEKAIYEESGVKSSIGISFIGKDKTRAYFIDFSSPEANRIDPVVIDSLKPIRTILQTVIAGEIELKQKAEH